MSKKEPFENPGAAFETMALAHLKKHGLKLLTRNYHSRYGEIDLIMKSKKTIVFVEVRKRAQTQYGHPLETVDHQKQQKIIRTAYAYLKQKHLFERAPCRFDVVGVTLRENQYHLEWCQHAYEDRV